MFISMGKRRLKWGAIKNFSRRCWRVEIFSQHLAIQMVTGNKYGACSFLITRKHVAPQMILNLRS
jgi:hypothetical protein